MTFRIFYPGDLNTHPSMPSHPERAYRIWAALEGVKKAKVGPRDYRIAPVADIKAALVLHEEGYVASLMRQFEPDSQYRMLDGGDTHQARDSLSAALSGVGAACTAIDDLMASNISGSFVVTRPPGHHACKSSAMGFCLLGTAALAAAHANRKHGLRVAILDFDLHHGNGSVDLLWNEPDIFFASTHQQGIWPLTGSTSSEGAYGQIMNIPLTPGSGSLDMRRSWQLIFDRVRSWRVDLIIVSAGFDAHADDPLSGLSWTMDDYTWLGSQINLLASEVCEGRVLSILEGGYDLSVLSCVVPAYLEALHPEQLDVATCDDCPVPLNGSYSGSPYVVPSVRYDGEEGFACIKTFSRLWIQNRETGDLVYTPPEFLRLNNRQGLVALAASATHQGCLDINDVIKFEHDLLRVSGYRQRSSHDFIKMK